MDNKNKLKLRWNIIFLMIAVSSLVIRLLMHYRFDKSALLYVGIPFLIALALMWVDRPKVDISWKRKFGNLVLVSLVVMLGSSVILFEGFLCVVMFMPIYFGVILLVFLIKYLAEYIRNRRSRQLFSHVLPLILVFSAFEGTHPQLSFDRQNQVILSQVVHASISEIRQQLVRPIHLQKDRDWFLEFFPMPYKVDASSLEEGDYHQLDFRYHRWFVTNTHTGNMLLKIEQSDDSIIKLRFVEDTSYIANYLKLQSSELQLVPIDGENTQVTLVVDYIRLLDPAWYFEPLQHYGISKSMEFFLAEVVTPNE